MRRKYFFALLAGMMLSFILGCSVFQPVKTKDISPYVPLLVERELSINVGMDLLADDRPAVDKELTKDIKNVPDEVTLRLLEFFKQGTLKNIHYPSQPEDNLIITGEIRRFMWRAYSKAPTYIPLINLYVYLGIPCKTAYSLTNVYLELKDKKTGQVIETFNEYSKVANSYNLYEFKNIDSTAELEASFKEVARKLRGKLVYKIMTYSRRKEAESAQKSNFGTR